METMKIFLAIFVLMFAGFRLYQKYFKKDQEQPGNFRKSEGSSFPGSNSKEDDYEPYSKK